MFNALHAQQVSIALDVTQSILVQVVCMVCILTELHVQSVHHSVPHASAVLFALHVPTDIFLCKVDRWRAILRVGFSTVRLVRLHA